MSLFLFFSMVEARGFVFDFFLLFAGCRETQERKGRRRVEASGQLESFFYYYSLYFLFMYVFVWSDIFLN